MTDLNEKRKQYQYALVIFTDHADFITNSDALSEPDRLLEIRCFDTNGEYRLYRSTVDGDFCEREIRDTGAGEGVSFDEEQYLDIDTDKTAKLHNGLVYATGGGSYHLPVATANKLKVRYYYTYDDNGIARKTDWRLVDFVTKEEDA